MQYRIISFLKMMDLWLVETTAAEPTDTENRVYLPKHADQKLNKFLSNTYQNTLPLIHKPS